MAEEHRQITVSYQQVYRLKQVTPLLHFQPGQTGATLRATQVKPALDRFLLGLLKKEGTTVPSSWLLPNGKPSLDYKLFIQASGAPLRTNERYKALERLCKSRDATAEDRRYIQSAMDALPEEQKGTFKMPRAFFGNLASGKYPRQKADSILNHYKEAFFFPDPLTMTVFSRHRELRQLIHAHIQEFFFLHNFGTRTGKGFGSFEVIPENGLTPLDPVACAKKHYGSFIYLNTGKPFGAPEQWAARRLNCAASLMQIMKSGINQDSRFDGRSGEKLMDNGGYQESFLMKTFRLKGVGSEKLCLKAKGVIRARNYGSRPQVSAGDVAQYQFVRALLGLAGSISFRDDVYQDEITITSRDGKIQRFPCPIQVKITSGEILFLPQSYPPELFRHPEFLFLNKKGKIALADKTETVESLLRKGWCVSLSVPPAFDLPGFLLEFGRAYNSSISSKIQPFRGSMFQDITRTIRNGKFLLANREQGGV